MNSVAEICCGSLEDSLNAQKAGADRIELNNAMYLYGLTPSLGTIELVVEYCHIPIVAMARPRPGGFHYNEYEFDTIRKDVESMLAYDIEGVAFGCLDEAGNIDVKKNQEIIDIIHKHNKDAIFHRAFDAVKDPYQSIELLIDLGVKRVLTSGLQPSAVDGVPLLAELQGKYGDRIEILAGGGIDAANCAHIKNKTGIQQYHSSCKTWRKDPTTIGNVSFAFAEPPHQEDYNIVGYNKAISFVNAVKRNTVK
ncbi:copper homeostasis protein CutC [Virgibacillus soli]|uniref:PF03932 family protein CutC n=1 Tax=Paracerasibacillus soli TaxID=480284 RepID=A0ABU5CSC5_9BACI|nr:copper homeostasis protein CutC [Virgibacillus soli]MDY0409282.1 copper homeostasis protein CutC [Virgibacillus soli]